MAQAAFREAGSGPTVACFHSNASHAGQWRSLMDLLAPRFRVLAIDSYGSGKSPEWPSPTEITLADEVAFAEPLLAAPLPMHLVGHSYGGAVALRAALQHPQRYASLVLYEPTLFALVDKLKPPPNGTEGIKAAVIAAADCLARGDTDGAGRAFIDFWMGPGNWDRMPPERRAPLAAATTNIRRWAHALVTDPVQPDDLRTLRMPVLLLTGAQSPESAHAVIRALQGLLPNVTTIELPGLGHMAPVSHPQPVNAEIARFLDGVSGKQPSSPSPAGRGLG
jgi:pimeloyl-ACP methyl ester carboxylesterase